MQNARQQHFDWEPRATAHKSSSTRTSAVVCEPGETAHKSSSTRTVAVVCEPCENAHKSSSTRTNTVVCEPGQTAHKSAPATSAVVCEPCETALKTSPNLPFARVVWEPRASAHHTCWPGYLSSVRRDSACSRWHALPPHSRMLFPRILNEQKKEPCLLSLLSQQNPCRRPPRCSSLVCAHTLWAPAATAPTPMCRAWTGRRVMVSWMLAIAQ